MIRLPISSYDFLSGMYFQMFMDHSIGEINYQFFNDEKNVHFFNRNNVHYRVSTVFSFCLQEYNSNAEAGGYDRDAEELGPGEGSHR